LETGYGSADKDTGRLSSRVLSREGGLNCLAEDWSANWAGWEVVKLLGGSQGARYWANREFTVYSLDSEMIKTHMLNCAGKGIKSPVGGF